MTDSWVAIMGYLLAFCFLSIALVIYAILKIQANKASHYKKQSEQFKSALDAFEEPVWLKGKNGEYLYCNPAFEQLTGISKLHLVGKTTVTVENKEHLELNQPFLETIICDTEINNEEHIYQSENQLEYYQIKSTPLINEDQAPFATMVHARNVTSFRTREQELIETEIRVNEALKLTKVGIWEWNLKDDSWRATPSYFTMLGYPPETGIADRKKELDKIHPDDRLDLIHTINAILSSEKGPNFYKYKARIKHRDGHYRWIGVRCIVTEFDDEDKPARMLGVRIDIDDIQKAQDKLEWASLHDALTQLPNRVALNKRFYDLIKNNSQLAMLFIDLDNFKNINDTLGHGVGDKLLIHVAKRMQSLVKDIGYVARQGGDEFIILLPAKQENELLTKTHEIKEALSARYTIDHHQFFLTPSIGVSLYPRDGKVFETLYQRADTAMYHAKHMGRNQYAFFTQAMEITSNRALTLGNALHDALERNEFSLHYQPQISLKTGKLVGAEALIRWHSKELGHVSPVEFIPLAEDSGQILAIGEWVLRETARQLKEWRDQNLPSIRVAVNLSYAQFHSNDLPNQVEQILNEFGIPAELLELELTERVATKNPEHTITTLTSLQKLGVQASIDDFGTGYSSLSYLQRFPVYKLKIDRSFVHSMTTNNNDKIIVAAVITLAKQLGMKTIAEGVETKKQQDMLKHLGCDDVQGYLISRPIPADLFKTEFITTL